MFLKDFLSSADVSGFRTNMEYESLSLFFLKWINRVDEASTIHVVCCRVSLYVICELISCVFVYFTPVHVLHQPHVKMKDEAEEEEEKFGGSSPQPGINKT